jgi:ribokinase
MKLLDVVGFGALNVDRLFKVDKIAKAEEESFVTRFQEACGGSAANTIVGLARLGCTVGFIGKVAGDREGKMLLDEFHRERVDTTGVVQAERGRSGTAMGFVDKKGNRALYIDAGVNDAMCFDEIDLDYVSRARFVHLTSFVGEKSFQAQKEVVERLPENVRISFDPGVLYARKGLGALDSIVSRTRVLTPNSRELRQLTGIDDPEKGAERMLKKGARIVAVKLGSKGCYVTDGKESHHIAPFKVKVVDTTGAGDAFCAGFLYGLLKGKSLRECGRIGNFVASRCVMMMGARAGLPCLKELGSLS